MEDDLNNQSTVSSTASSWFSKLAEAASGIYSANRNASAASKNASAANANAAATILSSRNMIIAAVVLVVGIGLFMFMRRK